MASFEISGLCCLSCSQTLLGKYTKQYIQTRKARSTKNSNEYSLKKFSIADWSERTSVFNNLAAKNNKHPIIRNETPIKTTKFIENFKEVTLFCILCTFCRNDALC